MISLLITVYMLTRFFIPFQALWLWGDLAKYLGCARTFPRSALYNRSYYDLHPAGYPYAVRLLSVFMPDYKAAVMVSVFSSLFLFSFAFKIMFFLSLPQFFIWVALTYLILNHLLYEFSYMPFRYSLFACLFTVSFYFILVANIPYAVIFGGLAFFVADILPLPLIPAFLIYGHPWGALFTLIFYFLTVLLPKIIVYSRNEYYAGGVEGRLERVRPFTLKQLISPFYFQNTAELFVKMQFTPTLRGIKNKFFGIIGLRWKQTSRLNWVMLGLALLGLDWRLGIVSLFILFPIIFSGFLPRNSIAFVPIFAYFIARGIIKVVIFLFPFLFFIPEQFIINYTPFFVLFLIAIMIRALRNNYFVLNLKKIDQCKGLVKYTDTLDKDGIAAEGLISQALAYHSNKRVVALPRTPDKDKAIQQLNMAIGVFDLNYVIISEFWRTEELPYPVIDYIKTDTKFKLIHTMEEEYDTKLKSDILIAKDKFYIYEII